MESEITPQTLSQALDLLKQAKPLFESNDSIWLSFIGVVGAIGGALATFFPSHWISRQHDKKLRESVAFQIYSEIQATIQIEKFRGYTKNIRDIIQQFENGDISSCSYTVNVSGERFLVYKANISNLGHLPPKLQQKIVLLYQALEGAVQDMQPGGYLNKQKVEKEQFKEFLSILEMSRKLADEILAEIEHTYPHVR